jgi:hypothetical protein
LQEYIKLVRRIISMHVPGEDAVRDLPTGCTTNSHIESSAVLVVVSYRLVGRSRINLAHVPREDVPCIYQAVVVVVVAPKVLTQQAAAQFLLVLYHIVWLTGI